jgi:hypothetical protein
MVHTQETEVAHAQKQDPVIAHLFDAAVQYLPEAGPVISAEDREGEFVGTGEGTVEGGRIKGTLRISFFAVDCAFLLVRAGLEVPPGQHLCRENPGGIIETSDGARIWLDGRGYGLRGADLGRPRRWSISLALQFSTGDPRYWWINRVLGILQGEFDEETGAARYKVYVPG